MLSNVSDLLSSIWLQSNFEIKLWSVLLVGHDPSSQWVALAWQNSSVQSKFWTGMVLTVLVVKSSFSFEKTTHLIYEVGPQESTIHGIIRGVVGHQQHICVCMWAFRINWILRSHFLFFFFFLHVNNNLTWVHCTGDKNHCSRIVYHYSHHCSHTKKY